MTDTKYSFDTYRADYPHLLLAQQQFVATKTCGYYHHDREFIESHVFLSIGLRYEFIKKQPGEAYMQWELSTIQEFRKEKWIRYETDQPSRKI